MRLRALVVAGSMAAGAGGASADPDTREAALRDPAVDVDIERAALRLSWRADAVAATESLGIDGELGSTATASIGGEVAISHEACDIVVAGGQLDLRGGDEPMSFQQWASLCLLGGVMGIQFDHRLAWDVRPRLLAPPRMRPGASRHETAGFEMTGVTSRLNDPGPLSLAPPPPESTIALFVRMELGIGWLAEEETPLDVQVKVDMRGFGFRRERADGGAPLEVWGFIGRADILTLDDVMANSTMATVGRFDAVEVSGARAAGLQFGGRIGLGMGIVTGGDATRPLVASALTALGELSAERQLATRRDADQLIVRGALARDAWPLWDGRMVVDDRATLGLRSQRGSLRYRGELSIGRSHLVAADGSISHGTTGGLTSIVDYDLGRHVTLRKRTEIGAGVYAPGATADAPRRAVEILLTAMIHAGNR